MRFLDRLVARDHRLADTKYADRESASEKASRERRQRHRNGGAAKAAAKGQKWEQQDRKRFRC